MSRLVEKRMKTNKRDKYEVGEVKEDRINIESIQEKVRQKILNSDEFADMAGNEKELWDKVFQLVSEECPQVPRVKRTNMVDDILNDIFGYGPLEKIIHDPDVTDIMVNSPTRIFYEKNGKKHRSEVVFRDEVHLRKVIDRIVSGMGRRVDESSPMVDARMPDGSRVNVVVRPIALNGASISIRRFREQFGAEDLVERGTISRDAMELLKELVDLRLSTVVAGGTGTGKTTFLNALSSFIPTDERVVTVEDTSELQLKVEDWVKLETRPPNIQGEGEITAQLLVANALRMRPDRIIVGECRRGEAFDMLQAMNTGHPGSMTTLHSNSVQDTIARLESMVMMSGYPMTERSIRENIASAIDLIVYLKRLRDGRRIVERIAGLEMEDDRVKTVDLFKIEGGDLVPVKGAEEKIESMKEVMV